MYATFSARWQRRYSLAFGPRHTKPDASSDALKLMHTSVRLSVTGIESLWIWTLDSSGVSLGEGVGEGTTGTELEDDGTMGIELEDESTGTVLEDSTGTELEEDSTGVELDKLGAWSQGFSSVHSITGATQTVPLAHSRIVQTFSGEWHWMYSGLVLFRHRKPLASGSGSYSSQILRIVSSGSEDDSGTGTELDDAGTELEDDDCTGTELDDSTGTEDEDTGTELDEETTGMELDDSTGTEDEDTGTELDDDCTGTELDEDTGTELEDSTGMELEDDSTGTELDSTGTELDDEDEP